MMTMLFEALAGRGWNVRLSRSTVPLLPPSVAARYPAVPPEVVAFLSSIEVCINPTCDSWFLTAIDYGRQAGPGFRWNEYEHMSLESCRHQAERAEVSAFWNAHFPFMLAVHSDYDYLAVTVAGDHRGSIVHGYAPEWEEPSIIAPSFDEFLRAFSIAATAEEPSWPECLFL